MRVFFLIASELTHTPSWVPKCNVSTMYLVTGTLPEFCGGYFEKLKVVFTWHFTNCGSIFTPCSQLVPEQDSRWATQPAEILGLYLLINYKERLVPLNRRLNSYFSLEKTGPQTVKLTLYPSVQLLSWGEFHY